ncbi:hypothetical protein [Kitasatospora sp. NPDC090091]
MLSVVAPPSPPRGLPVLGRRNAFRLHASRLHASVLDAVRPTT